MVKKYTRFCATFDKKITYSLLFNSNFDIMIDGRNWYYFLYNT